MGKKQRDLFYNFWSVAIVLCVFIVVFSFIFASCSESKPLPPPKDSSDQQSGKPEDEADDPSDSDGGAVEGEEESAAPVVQQNVTELQETEDMGIEYQDKLTFLGDSTTLGMQTFGVLSDGTDTKQVWLPRNGTFALFNQDGIRVVYPETGEEILLEDAVALGQPEYMVITLGVNGVNSMDEDFFIREYTALINRILQNSPNTKIILNSIYPVARSYDSLDQINNEKIDAANIWVRKVAEQTNSRFINSASVLKDSEGWLPEDYQSGDGIHLTRATMEKILQYIRTHGYV